MIKLYKRPWKILWLLTVSSLFVAWGFWMISGENNSTTDLVMGFLGISFFGIGLLTSLYYLLDIRPQIIITNEFFQDRMSRTKFFWGELEDCFPYEILNQKFLSMKLPEAKKRNQIYRFFQRLNSKFGAHSSNINISYLNINPDKFSDFIKMMNRIEPQRRSETIEAFKDRIR